MVKTVLTSWTLSAIRYWFGNKKTRNKIEEIFTDIGHLGLSVQKYVCLFQLEKSLLNCLSCDIDLMYRIHPSTNCFFKKILKSLLFFLKGHLSLYCLKESRWISQSDKGIGL